MFFSTNNEIVDTQFLFAQTLHNSLFDASMRTTGMEVRDKDEDKYEDEEDKDDEDGYSCTHFVQFLSLVVPIPS